MLTLPKEEGETFSYEAISIDLCGPTIPTDELLSSSG